MNLAIVQQRWLAPRCALFEWLNQDVMFWTVTYCYDHRLYSLNDECIPH